MNRLEILEKTINMIVGSKAYQDKVKFESSAQARDIKRLAEKLEKRSISIKNQRSRRNEILKARRKLERKILKDRKNETLAGKHS